MLVEVAFAFVIVLAASGVLYGIGRLLSPRHVKNETKEATYACGEKATQSKPRISVANYKYLVFFAIIDSAVILVAFGALAMNMLSFPILIVYLIVVLVSTLLLFDGGKD
jgi:NADH:ubiquinone oxidoreductase subunit 3 (subunit A)